MPNLSKTVAAVAFVVKDFASNTSAGNAHGAIPTLYAELAGNAATTQKPLENFQTNRYSGSGSTSRTRHHEGVVTVRSKSLGILATIDGFTTGGTTQKVSFVEAGIADPAGSSSSLDTIVSLRDVSLSNGNSIEKIMLSGRSNLKAKGNALAQTLTGNEEINHLEGGGGINNVTGDNGADTLTYSSLLDSLIGGTSKALRLESLTDFDLLDDRIEATGQQPSCSGDAGIGGSRAHHQRHHNPAEQLPLRDLGSGWLQLRQPPVPWGQRPDGWLQFSPRRRDRDHGIQSPRT